MPTTLEQHQRLEAFNKVVEAARTSLGLDDYEIEVRKKEAPPVQLRYENLREFIVSYGSRLRGGAMVHLLDEGDDTYYRATSIKVVGGKGVVITMGEEV